MTDVRFTFPSINSFVVNLLHLFLNTSFGESLTKVVFLAKNEYNPTSKENSIMFILVEINRSGRSPAQLLCIHANIDQRLDKAT